VHTSEDIVQEIFIRIWQDRRDLIMTDTIRWYLFTAVRNNSISHLRKEKNSILVEWKEQEAWEEPVLPKEAGSYLDYEGLLQIAIDRLPPKCREIFVLSRLSNMTYKQIAASLNISIKTVENQLGKALKIMRLFLKEKGIYLVYLLAGFFP
jgi:RNA polymerase sigma-70 factor (ECF subfamily)